MATDPLHPDHLQIGDSVGPWRIVQVLGRGGSSRVLKVERDGRPYTLKIALLPMSEFQEALSEEEQVREAGVYRRLAREAATLFTYSSHPNILRVYAVDFWPHPSRGYPFIVTDFVDGDTWHERRWRNPFHAAGLVDTFGDVVRTVGMLHERGMYHRDIKADNVLIRREDGRPFLIDFGTVHLPKPLTWTLGVPDGVLHLLPPELISYTRRDAWKRGERFHGGVAADLYALGVLLYEGLTDLHPFDPELPDEELVAAIATVRPTAPHLLNPLVPRSLSDIALRLLEKKPEARYPSTQALLQALEEAAGKERTSPAWKVPLTPPRVVAEATREERTEPRVQLPEARPEVEAARPPEEAPPRDGAPRAEAPPQARGTGRGRWLIAVLAGLLLVVAIGLLSRRALLSPSPPAAPGASAPAQRGTLPMSQPTPSQDSATPRGSSRSRLFAAWLCATTGLGCPSVQVKPPKPEQCPKEVTDLMFKELELQPGRAMQVVIDVNQPRVAETPDGLYQDGPVVGRVWYGQGRLVEGTLLYGYLWTGPGIKDEYGGEAIIGRYTKALLPDGKEYPVCLSLNGPPGRMDRVPGSKPGTVSLPREHTVTAVWRFK
ncbi:protein kinase domain-containing protein [Archangium sp.]|uniref:serine/threonine protein kinase n=1 Tax=Archangium sp. TaxID=1872627 RepID=UPI00286A0ACC|nr:protein kinase [Archangium sp.]